MTRTAAMDITFATSPAMHPRRSPAHLSVSLRHDSYSSGRSQPADVPPQNSNHTRWDPSDGNNDSSTGRSPGREGAQKWFSRSNRRPEAAIHFGDNEPPYFLPDVSLSDSMGASEQILTLPSMPSNPNNGRIISASTKSTTDDFRSVIDDLTIENKRLKEKLRRLERNSQAPYEQGKLFEVKIHSLPSRKRKQLEDTLRAFASSLSGSDDTRDRQEFRFPTTGSCPCASLDSKGSACQHASSSSTSSSRPADSAYASMSQSGPTYSSSTHQITFKGKSARHKQMGEERKVQSFLHNIPKGFFPRHSAVMTEHQKKNLVVLRLEQLFVGKKGVIAGVHSQPVQQQEVSRSAAQADRDADNGPVRKEGVREARIHHWDLDVSKPGKFPNDSNRDTQMYTSYPPDEVFKNQSSFEQRPTRPLDLDPDRAQIPSENADYLRHLGLSTPNFSSDESTHSAADDDGWIYLNLLINMAQLHTINVTPEFVRAAVSEISEKFQISTDGKKLRWRGGSSGTQLSNDSGNSSAQNQSLQNSDNSDEKPKRRKVNTGRFVSIPVDIRRLSSSGENLLQYKPLFHHHPSDNSMRDSSEDGSIFDYNHNTRNGTAAFSSAPRIGTTYSSPGTPRFQRGDGPITFYNSATFCTDLSGDPGITTIGTSVEGSEGLQVSGPRLTCSPTASGSVLSTRPFKDVESISEQLAGQRTPDLFKADPGESEDYFDKQPLEYSSRMMPLQSFEASGLGGTQPADHFALGVETRRTQTSTPISTKLSRFSAPGSRTRRFAHLIPENSLRSFFQSGSQDTDEFLTHHLASMAALDSPSPPSIHASKILHPLPIKTEVLSTRFIRLEPSALPPPSGYYAAPSSSDDESGEGSTSGSALHSRYYEADADSGFDGDENSIVEMAEEEDEDEEETEENI